VFPDLVSINEADKTPFSIYPNPANDVVNIDLEENKEWDRLQLIDVSGKVVIDKNITSNSITLNTSKLNRGVYFINLIGDQKKESRKLILN
jgi:hypothetical protein